MGATEPAKRATVIAFVVLGIVNSSWAARVPQVREALGLNGPQLGLLLLCMAVGAVSALPGAGPLIARVGSRRTLRLGLALTVVGLAIAAVGVSSRRIMIVAAGLFVYGTATALWDVAINLQGTAVERALGRSFLPRLHATYSAGSVGGALLGVVAIVLGVSPAADLGAIGVLAAAVVWWAGRRFLPDATNPLPEVGVGVGRTFARGVSPARCCSVEWCSASRRRKEAGTIGSASRWSSTTTSLLPSGLSPWGASSPR